jgi:hypothetical protein
MDVMTERKPQGMSFETWVESQISRSIARGDFEARREGVDTAAMLPPGLGLRRERDELPARAARLTTEDEVRALAEDYNARVEAFWRRPAESRWSPVPGLADVDELVAGWRDDRPPPPPPPVPLPPPASARRRLRFWRRTRRG